MIEEAGKIAGLYVSSVEKMLKAHPQTVRNYWRFRATDWWYNNKWPWFGPEVDHYKLGACNCLEWAEQVYSDVAGNRGTTEFRHFDLYKGNSTSWYGYQHNFVVITPKIMVRRAGPRKDPLVLLLDPVARATAVRVPSAEQPGGPEPNLCVGVSTNTYASR